MRRARRSGFAVLMVLVIVSIVAAVAAGAIGTARQAASAVLGLQLQTQGGLAADAAVRLAAIRLLNGATISEAGRSPLDWPPFRVAVTIEDEGGKIDLNRGSPRLLTAVLATLPVEPRSYRQLTLQPHRRFVSVDELAGLLGVAGADVVRMRRLLTVHGSDAIDKRTADPGLVRLLDHVGLTSGSRLTSGAPAETSTLNTYTIHAVAKDPGQVALIRRSAVVRLTPGFTEPFEWLERWDQ